MTIENDRVIREEINDTERRWRNGELRVLNNGRCRVGDKAEGFARDGQGAESSRMICPLPFLEMPLFSLLTPPQIQSVRLCMKNKYKKRWKKRCAE